MYPEELTAPMIEDLTSVGFNELKTPAQVDAAFKQPGTTLCVVNSVCGCAAGACRPGVRACSATAPGLRWCALPCCAL